MPSLMLFKLFATTKTCWADVHSVARLAYGVCALDSYGMGEIGIASIALYLETRFVHS